MNTTQRRIVPFFSDMPTESGAKIQRLYQRLLPTSCDDVSIDSFERDAPGISQRFPWLVF
jgi:hypothetical protein